MDVCLSPGCDETAPFGSPWQSLPCPSEAYTVPRQFDGSAAYFGTFHNEVLGIDLQARRISWHYQDSKRQFPFYSSAALVGGTLIVGGRDKLVHCLNAKTGKGIWTFPTRARVESSPAVVGSRAYVGSNDGHFYVLEGTWWVGTGNKFDPDNLTVPMRAGTYVTHLAKGVHWDGAKADEDATIIVIGNGPATNTRVEEAK
jgi:hypothetical protein